MARKRFQSVRVTLAGGKHMYFFGPVLEDEDARSDAVLSIDMAFELECDDELSARDLWLLTQPGDLSH